MNLISNILQLQVFIHRYSIQLLIATQSFYLSFERQTTLLIPKYHLDFWWKCCSFYRLRCADFQFFVWNQILEITFNVSRHTLAYIRLHALGEYCAALATMWLTIEGYRSLVGRHLNVPIIAFPFAGPYATTVRGSFAIADGHTRVKGVGIAHIATALSIRNARTVSWTILVTNWLMVFQLAAITFGQLFI